AVRQLDVHQRVNRNSRVSGELDKGVQGERQAIVQFVCEVLEQARIVDCHVQREIGRVDEVSVLTNRRDDLVAGLGDRASYGALSRLVQFGREQGVGVELDLVALTQRKGLLLGHGKEWRIRLKVGNCLPFVVYRYEVRKRASCDDGCGGVTHLDWSFG